MILGSKVRRGLAALALLVAAGSLAGAGPAAPDRPATSPDQPALNKATPPTAAPSGSAPIAMPGTIRIKQDLPNTPTPNAQTPTPNAQTPTPNAQTPTPNALTPTPNAPNQIPPNAPERPLPGSSAFDRGAPTTPGGTTQANAAGSGGNTSTTAPPPSATGAGNNTTISGAGGVAGANLNASSAADLLSKSNQNVGVEVQRRNAIVADPRVRGWRAGQFLTTADGGLFNPARLDLDSAVAKFDSTSVREINVIKGPYSVLYGPGFSFVNVNTIDSPRSDCFKFGGRTSAGYQTNGARWEGLQTVEVSDFNWGFRGTYNILQGNDYRSGDGTRVPASYFSQNFNVALGMNLDENNTIEFKALRVAQNDLEFPGLYFDIASLDTEAYSMRYTMKNASWFDKFTFDLWYNSTAASGDTQSGAKQAFVQRLLAQSFNAGLPTGPITPANAQNLNLFRDQSTTRFAGRSLGYRAALAWSVNDDLLDPNFILGTDFNAFGQGLNENISFTQIAGPRNVLNGQPFTTPANLTQQQYIPGSNQYTTGLFAQTKWDLGSRLTVRSGGRLDWVNSQSDPRLITGNIDLFGGIPNPGTPAQFTVDPLQYSTQPNNRTLGRDDLLLAGFIRSEYKLDDQWKAIASFGHSQRAPTLTELYAAGPFIGVLQQGTSRLIGDPHLSPEKLTQFDIGLEANYEFVRAGATVFYAWVNDYITYDANRLGNGLTQVVYTNTDRASLAGTELFLETDLTAWITPYATLSYVQGTDLTAVDNRRPGNLDSSRRDSALNLTRKSATEGLPQIPPLESRVGFRFHAPSLTPKWSLDFSARMVAGQTHIARSLGEVATPGFTVFNIRGFWQVNDTVLLTAGVENLGDRNYREHLDPISGNVLGTGALLRPGTNFFFNTSIKY